MTDITITAKISPDDRFNGFRVYLLVNGKVHQPQRNFRKTERGAVNLVNECANEIASDMRKFGNRVTINFASKG
jgi:hypothetical protein